MEALANAATFFIGLFQKGGEVFASLVVGIIPLLIVLMTFVNALITLIGPEKIEKLGETAGKEGIIYTPLRYMIFPFLSFFFLTNPMCYTMGRFLPEKYKIGFIDAAFSMAHPALGLFPHMNPGEIFVWAGIASGVEQAGFGLGDLAIRYFLVGLVVILLRGIVTEKIFNVMYKGTVSAEAQGAV
jgi:PTS system glucitol/sorbitol-specific IIC component